MKKIIFILSITLVLPSCSRIAKKIGKESVDETVNLAASKTAKKTIKAIANLERSLA